MLKAQIFQSLLLFMCVSSILMLYSALGGIFVASLGASGFILFATPHTNSSQSRNLAGGYLCGTAAGILSSLLYNQVTGLTFPGSEYALVFICAAAPASAMLLMTSTNLIHPPAAAFALGLSIEPYPIQTTIAAVVGVITLCLIRAVLSKYLKNLI